MLVNIPLAILAAAVAMWASGQTVNLMTLGGLALAVGILVDESTVVIENVHSHLGRSLGSNNLAQASYDGTAETVVPNFMAMLCILAVFVSAFFMQGAARNLFIPLALAVGFAMVASFLLSATLVPVLLVWFLRPKPHQSASARRTGFDQFRDGYRSYHTGRGASVDHCVGLSAYRGARHRCVIVGNCTFGPRDFSGGGRGPIRASAPRAGPALHGSRKPNCQ